MEVLMRTTSLLLVLLGLTACAPEPTLIELQEGAIQVHAIVHAGSDTTSVTVMRGRRSTTGADDFDYIDPVTNAMVRLVHAQDTTVLVQGRMCIHSFFPGQSPGTTRLNNGCYSAAVSGGIRVGTTYELRIDVPGEAPIFGSARVPAPVIIQSPSAGTELQIDTTSSSFVVYSPVLVRWAHPEQSQYVTLRFQADRAQCELHIAQPGQFGSRIGAVETVGVDTVSVQLFGSECGTTQREPARLIVTVFDTAYTRYVRLLQEDAVRLRDAAAGITGALGVFSAAASASVPVVLVPR
jgi:hypothetical protein